MFEGGPQPLPSDPKGYFQTLSSESDSATRITAVGKFGGLMCGV